MSSNNRTDLLAWISNVAALHTELSRPIEGVSDPRYVALAEKFGGETVQSITPEEAGRDYWALFSGKLIPLPPLPVPTFSKSHTLYTDDYPNTVTVEFLGEKWQTGSGADDPATDRASAQVMHSFYIAMRDFDDEQLNPVTRELVPMKRTAGDVWSIQRTMAIEYVEPAAEGFPSEYRLIDVTVDSARSLVVALGDALFNLPFDPNHSDDTED